VNEWLEKNYKDCETVEDESVVIKTAIRALQEVVESGDNTIEVSVLRRGKALEKIEQSELKEYLKKVEEDKAREAAEAEEEGKK
jgi:20S proteasome alpha/beta subunit